MIFLGQFLDESFVVAGYGDVPFVCIWLHTQYWWP